MTDTIGDLLPKRQFDEPEEIGIIKDFVTEKFGQPVKVSVQPARIIIIVNSSALAGALRTRLRELQALCKTDKQLIIRIGI